MVQWHKGLHEKHEVMSLISPVPPPHVEVIPLALLLRIPRKQPPINDLGNTSDKYEILTLIPDALSVRTREIVHS